MVTLVAMVVVLLVKVVKVITSNLLMATQFLEHSLRLNQGKVVDHIMVRQLQTTLVRVAEQVMVMVVTMVAAVVLLPL